MPDFFHYFFPCKPLIRSQSLFLPERHFVVCALKLWQFHWNMKSWWICAFVLEIYSNYVDSYDTMPKSHLNVINLIFDNNQTKNMQCLIVIVLVCKSLYKCSCDLYLRPINIFETFSSVIFLPLFIETELYVDEKILS